MGSNYISSYCWRRPQTNNALIFHYAKESDVTVEASASN